MNESEELDHAESHLLQQNNTSSYHLAHQRGMLSHQEKSAPNNKTTSIASNSTSPNANRSWRAPIIMLSSLIAVSNLGPGLSQEWTSRYATAFAFLIQMTLVICVGTAFVQRQWLHFTTRQQPVKVDDFDKITSVLGDILSFCSKLWLKNPLLAILALTSWLIPLAAVITPGSLTIQQMPWNSTVSHPIPQLAFENMYSFVVSAYLSQQDTDSSLPIQTSKLTKIAWATAMGGQILPMTPLYANESYAFSFFGPTLQCNAADSALLSYERDNLYSLEHTSDVNQPFLFHAWTAERFSPLPDIVVLNSSNLIIHDSSPIDLGYQLPSAQPEKGCSIYITSIMGIQDSLSNNSQTPKVIPNVTECRLHNATYTMQVDFLDNIQTTTTSIDYLNPVPGILFNQIEDPQPKFPPAYSYTGIMSAFGELLVGYAKVYSRIENSTNGPTNYLYGTVGTHFDLLDIDWTRSEPMISGLEQLFTNITLSLLSDSAFLDTSAAPHSITVVNWSNTYTYNQFQLLLPYGLALLVSFISFLIGTHSFYISQTSYQNKFSSFVRASINKGIEEIVTGADTGSDPLPKVLAQKVIIMGKR